jgi:transcription initiation factor TFIIH subunit 4
VAALLRAAGLMCTHAEAAATAAAAAAAGPGGAGGSSAPPPPALPAASSRGEPLVVTEAGFRYLLLPRASQLWLLLQHYLGAAEALGGDPPAVVSFLLRLSFLPPHLAQPTAGATPSERRLLGDLSTLGMLYIFGGGAGVDADADADGDAMDADVDADAAAAPDDGAWYCPTPLASAVAAGLAQSSGARPVEGHIIVETNYRVYAYTSSPLELAVLRFFVRPEYRLPNLFVGSLTRESVTAALACGITAEQVVAYLQQHAHPHVAARVPAVPETVADQVRLWARDTQRLRASPATLYDDFPSAEAYAAAAAHARGLDALLWHDDAKRVFVARREVQPAMREFFRLARERGALT